MSQVDRQFGEKFLTSVDDFDRYGVHLLFNDWWEKAPQATIDAYVAAIESHPEQRALAAEGYLAEPFDLSALEPYAPGTLGAAWRGFMVENNLAEKLAAGYLALHDEIAASGRLDRMPPVLRYKVLRGFQTHDLHHVLTGYGATPFDELSLQAFGLAQMRYPYAGMWIAIVTSHMTLLDPGLIEPAMTAIVDGWSFGKRARSIQFVAFEKMLDRSLHEVRKEYGLDPAPRAAAAA
jgi:ubiquinone biosynthesis protein Coq4